jgi:hypothetical protein
MKAQVEAATADLVNRLSSVSDKQDNMLERQEEMDGQLREVGERVEAVQGGVAVLQHQVGGFGGRRAGGFGERAGRACAVALRHRTCGLTP